MAPSYFLGYFSPEKPKQPGITPAMALEALEIYYDLKKKGLVGGEKRFHYFDQDLLWQHPEYAPFKGKYVGKPFEWRYNVAQAWTLLGLAGVKDIHSNIANSDIDEERHHAALTIRSLYSGLAFGTIEGTDISDARTSFPALRVMDLCIRRSEKIVIFIFGAKAVAEWHVRLFAAHDAARISRIVICSPQPDDGSEPTSIKLVRKLGAMPFELTAVTDDELLPQAKLVIGCTNGGTPLFKKEKLARGVRTVSLSGDEMPAGHIEDVLKNGHPICDGIQSCSERGGQSMQLWFERRGTKLADEAEKYGIKELALMDPLEEDDDRPVHCTSVGSAVQDLILGALFLLEVSKERRTEETTRMLMDGIGKTQL